MSRHRRLRTWLAAGAAIVPALAGCGTAVATPPPPKVTAAPKAPITASLALPTPAATAALATATATATATVTPAATATPTATARPPVQRAKPAALLPVDRVTAFAERQYGRETGGAVIRSDLRRIVRDASLRRDARSGSLAALRAYVTGQFNAVWYHQHVSRLQIARAGKVVVDVGVPFVVDGPSVTLPGGDTLRISIQDEIGFVRLIHRHHPVDVVVRGQAGQVQTSLPAAAATKLPAGGAVTIGGLRYDVRSFARTALGGEPVPIWILARA